MMNNLNQQVNQGIKQSGAPIPFSPKAQANITGVFGNPISNSYDRSMATNPALAMSNNITLEDGLAPPTPTIAPIVPTNNLY